MNEVFADYFINEFEDPLNAYTNAMGNYSGVAAALQQQQINQQTAQILTGGTPNPLATAPAPLPTGGIRTAFHTKQAAANNTQTTAEQPAVKKIKIEPGGQPQLAQVPPNIGQGGITGRLGYSMIGGQLVQQQHPAAPSAAAPQPATAPGAGGVALPVGVGIRLGGVGGVAPSTVRAGQQYSNLWPQKNSGNMSEQQIAERRQRNREHAKRSRVRKKFMLESLQEQVRSLQKENVELRMLIQEKIPDKAQSIISECCSKNTLFSDPTADDSDTKTKKDTTSLERSDFTLMESLTSGQQNFVLSDPRLPDNPIVYASPGFYILTGYTPEQVLGRNCRFLQGPATDPRAVDIIRKAIASGADATTCILNYKADGTPFWNQFFVAALRDSDNCIVNYVSMQSIIRYQMIM